MKRNSGFTLIEVLMVVLILGVVVVAGGSLFFAIMKGASKSEVIKEVKQNGDYALSVIERMVRNAQELDCTTVTNQITIINPDKGTTTFSCAAEDQVFKIASNSGRLTGKNVTLGEGVCPASLLFTCDQTKSPPTVTIGFTLSQAGTGGRQEEKAQVPFQTTVSLRTY